MASLDLAELTFLLGSAAIQDHKQQDECDHHEHDDAGEERNHHRGVDRPATRRSLRFIVAFGVVGPVLCWDCVGGHTV